MKRFYVVLGGLVSLVVLSAGEASAFGLGGMVGMFGGAGPPRLGVFGGGGFRGMSSGGFRGMSSGGYRGMSSGGYRGMSSGGYRRLAPNGYGRVIGPLAIGGFSGALVGPVQAAPDAVPATASSARPVIAEERRIRKLSRANTEQRTEPQPKPVRQVAEHEPRKSTPQAQPTEPKQKPLRQLAKAEARRPAPQAQRPPAQVPPPKPPSKVAQRQPSPPTLPPASAESRFVPDEVLFQVRNTVPPSAVADIARENRLTSISLQRLELIGSTLFRFRIPDRRPVEDVVRALEQDVRIASAQPNFVYRLAGDQASNSMAGLQYSVSKMQLPDAHHLATGQGVKVAVLDSGIDTAHPELAGSIADAFDAIDKVERPDQHGTAVASIIASKRNLLGVAPGATLLAIRAFTNGGGKIGEGGTTDHIVRSIEWAHQRGARVVNMSFTGPRDQLLSHELRAGVEKGIVFVGAAGDQGPNAAAADDSVIAVTAIDAKDKLYPAANRGPHICLAAPGVELVIAAPSGAHRYMSGTSLAAAHVSGAVALLLQSRPDLSPRAVRSLLLNRARQVSDMGRREGDCGIGFTNALALLVEPAETRPSQAARLSGAADQEISTGTIKPPARPSNR